MRRPDPTSKKRSLQSRKAWNFLLCHTKDFRDWPADDLREQESKPTSLVLRRVKALVGAVFDRDGHLFFASEGDLWEGDITMPSEPGEEPPAVDARRLGRWLCLNPQTLLRTDGRARTSGGGSYRLRPNGPYGW